MLNSIFDIQERVDYAATTSDIMYFCKYGVISGMYGQLLENRIFEPDDYDENKLNEILEENDDTNSDNSFGTPNIIVLFAESFWDVDQLLEEVEFNTKVTSNLEELKSKGIFFNMISPSYGGVSANVEFEFLTGANLMYFNKGYVPYMQLYNNKSYYYKPSIISELKNNGYNTKIVTYTSKELFDCGRFYNYIGVDETEYNTDIAEENIKGKYVSDEYVVDKIINEFENKDKNEKLFYMTLTMQAHMPYLIDKYENYDVNIVSSNLEQSMNETLISYAQGIYDTDKQLGRLYEYIQTLDEPTLLVFYGDHLPYLENSEGVNILDYLQYFNTDDELLNDYRMYNTQALILANFEINDDKNQYIGPDLLGAYILNRMDINISNYYKWLYNYKNNLAASNYIVSIDSKGQLYYTNNLSSELKEAYNIRKNMQYKFFIK
jgi:hypothetical protein